MEFNRAELESAEQELVDALEAGTIYGPETDDRDTWPVIRAQTIRNLLRGVYQDVTPDPKGLRLQRVRIDGRIDLDQVNTLIPLRLDRCDLPEGLSAVYARLPALHLQAMTIIHPTQDDAVLGLSHLHVGVLNLVGLHLVNEQGVALSADGLTVDSSARFVGGFTAVGDGDSGAVRIVGATIGSQLDLTGAMLGNKAGPALVADGITVGSDALLGDGFAVAGTGTSGVLRLAGATIGGQLGLAYARLPESVNKQPTVVLAGATVESDIVIDWITLKDEVLWGRWDLHRLTYRNVGGDHDLWLVLIRKGLDEYSPQPFQQFAAVTRASGDEKMTRKILITQHDDLLRRSRREYGLLTGRQRAALRMLKWIVGYGYRTWRALGWLVLAVGLAVVAAFTFGSDHWLWGGGWDWAAAALQQPVDSKAGSPGDPCRPVDLLVLGLETVPLIPLVSGGADRCFVTNSLAGTAFLSISVGLKIIAWALAALFVAGYTNIVRNPGP